MSTKNLTLKDCYAILGIPEGSDLEEVKRAYRKRAFELHPDLNPSDGASRQFQQLNEAYVVLINLLNSKPKGGFFQRKAPQPDATSAKAGKQAYEEQARQEQERRERQEAERRERQDAERRAREQQERQEKEKREAERRERLRSEIERQEAERLARKAKAKDEKEKQAKAREQAAREREEFLRQQPKPESHRRTYSKSSSDRDDKRSADAGWSTGTGSYSSTRPHPEEDPQDEVTREGLLNDLLNDPFARRVYEDIYSEVQNRKSTATEPERITPEPVREPAKDLSKNIGQAIKGWMRGQIDEMQELFFPAASLYPGAKFRLKIRPGLSGEPRTIEVTLPPDFTIGKAVRLRGMGKKLGKWQGDLYLTFQIKS